MFLRIIELLTIILPDRMLRLDANTTLNQSYVLFIIYQSVDQYLPSTHSWDSGLWQVLYIPLLLFFSPSCCFKLFSVQYLYSSNAYKPDQFLVLIKVSLFILQSVILPIFVIFYYDYYRYYFYYYFSCSRYRALIFFLIFLHVLICYYFAITVMS